MTNVKYKDPKFIVPYYIPTQVIRQQNIAYSTKSSLYIMYFYLYSPDLSKCMMRWMVCQINLVLSLVFHCLILFSHP